MQAEVVLHLPNPYSQHCSMQYTFVNVCCGEEQKLFNNLTCNHVKPSSHISQLHPFDAPCWTALPHYDTDAHVIQVNWIQSKAIVGANNYWPRLFIACAGKFSWSAGQLDCGRSPARAWKPETNQCGFALASSALE
ncbi:hypothetical protein O181_125460 [Austropuccinia psidii MF-1]|uniref:Uncharacterized protein n=1 Tax=Austropuccinia psidii MF-1 TaxID=1389203 RepID=A0A9Q3KUX0_9BASI|nr:hypothetical protein [Austropuccinia psidii MF-1]